MYERRKKKVVIFSIISLFVFIAIGFAIISQMLNFKIIGGINGSGDNNNSNLKVYIYSIAPIEFHGSASSLNSKVDNNKLSASFRANLFYPGDFVVYKVYVKNDGSVKVRLKDIMFTNDVTSKYVIYSNDATIGTEILPGSKMSFNVKVLLDESIKKFSESYTSFESNQTIKLAFEESD